MNKKVDIVPIPCREIQVELNKAILKHGLQREITPEMQMVIIMEELGEVAHALQERGDNLILEIDQTLAMLVKLRWLINEQN